jgi:hypothetical protein
MLTISTLLPLLPLLVSAAPAAAPSRSIQSILHPEWCLTYDTYNPLTENTTVALSACEGSGRYSKTTFTVPEIGETGLIYASDAACVVPSPEQITLGSCDDEHKWTVKSDNTIQAQDGSCLRWNEGEWKLQTGECDNQDDAGSEYAYLVLVLRTERRELTGKGGSSSRMACKCWASRCRPGHQWVTRLDTEMTPMHAEFVPQLDHRHQALVKKPMYR